MYSLQIDLLMLCLIQITFALLSFVYQNKTYETPFTGKRPLGQSISVTYDKKAQKRHGWVM